VKIAFSHVFLPRKYDEAIFSEGCLFTFQDRSVCPILGLFSRMKNHRLSLVSAGSEADFGQQVGQFIYTNARKSLSPRV
jgi:hypothetical protein